MCKIWSYLPQSSGRQLSASTQQGRVRVVISTVPWLWPCLPQSRGEVVISWSSALPVKVPIVSVYHGAVTCLPESKVSFPATEERGGYPKMGRIWRSGHCPLGGKDGCGPDGNNQPVVNHHIRSVRMILAQHPAVYPLYSMNNKQLGKVHVVLLLTVHRCFGLRPSVC